MRTSFLTHTVTPLIRASLFCMVYRFCMVYMFSLSLILNSFFSTSSLVRLPDETCFINKGNILQICTPRYFTQCCKFHACCHKLILRHVQHNRLTQQRIHGRQVNFPEDGFVKYVVCSSDVSNLFDSGSWNEFITVAIINKLTQ